MWPTRTPLKYPCGQPESSRLLSESLRQGCERLFLGNVRVDGCIKIWWTEILFKPLKSQVRPRKPTLLCVAHADVLGRGRMWSELFAHIVQNKISCASLYQVMPADDACMCLYSLRGQMSC